MIHWRYVTGESESAARGLAGDEFLMNMYNTWAQDDCPEPTLRIYTFRSHCALAGRYENVEAEINLPECRALGIEVNRRATGGGAILMGERQLMVTLATSSEHPIVPFHPARTLAKMARGVIAGLREMGVDAEYRPKNDIVVGGRKIGGSGICIDESGGFMYQASVLLDFDIPLMIRTRRLPIEKVAGKRIQGRSSDDRQEMVDSFEERITSVLRETGRDWETQQAMEAVCRGFEEAFKMSATHTPFSPVEMEKIGKLEREKYGCDHWLYLRQPARDMVGESVKKTPAGLVRAYVSMAGGTIKNVLITGDFFSGNRAVNDIESALKWGKTDRESIARCIRVAASAAGGSIQGLSSDELAEIVHSAVLSARFDQGDR
jgi:lipoate-protein ligase A